MTDPWDRYIYLHENPKNQSNVGKYTSPMDGMGFRDTISHCEETGWEEALVNM